MYSSNCEKKMTKKICIEWFLCLFKCLNLTPLLLETFYKIGQEVNCSQ